jgi:CelD/BcsL family acetyltransferase involved in cellulose biosynthesis
LNDTTAIEALAPEWAQLWDRCPAATGFQHPAWLLPWWRSLWGGGKPWWLALRDGARLVGLAPMFVWGHGRRCVSLAGSGISDYLDFLIEPRHAASATALVLEHMERNRDAWDLCDFQELRAGSPLWAASFPRLRVREENCGICPVLRLPRSWDEMLSTLPQKFRTDLRRARHRAANAGARIVAAAPDNLEALLSDLFRLHAARWKAREETGVMATPALQGFYAAAAAEFFRAGMLRLYAMRLEGAVIAVLYGFAGHGRFYAYLDGFDPEHGRLSPGTVLLSHAVECAISEGLAEFDFLRKGESFKYLWGGKDEVNRRLLIEA